MITIDNKNIEVSNELEQDIRLEIAITLYEKADYSFYVAAKFAGMYWMDFVKELGKRHISIFNEEDVSRDIETVKNTVHEQ